MALTISNCKLSSATIESCRAACRGTFSHMQEVTPRKCVCAEGEQSEWIIPR